MILSTIDHWSNTQAAFPAPVNTALSMLRERDLLALPAGRYALGDDPRMFFLIQTATTEPLHKQRAEAHTRHVDIQWLLAGAERYGVAQKDASTQIEEDLSEKYDVAFYAAPARETQIDFYPGSFGVFFPSDIHRATGQVDQPVAIHKVVVKLHRSLFGL
ncbi:N-acetylneuraminate anomerase [Silvimonas sp. JCM 19000]